MPLQWLVDKAHKVYNLLVQEVCSLSQELGHGKKYHFFFTVKIHTLSGWGGKKYPFF